MTAARGGGMGDLAELYAAHSRRLQQIVRTDVRGCEPVVEDACQFAWSRLVNHSDRVQHETALPWLATTAIREAVRLLNRAGREAPLENELGRSAQALPEQLVEQRERLAAVRQLPERQQRVVWLHALGLNYREIAAYQGCTVRTVERQLLRGRRALRGSTRQE